MITKKDLENYIYLDKCIKETKKKIAYYESKRPYAIHGKVRGSSAVFPYVERGFTVSGGGFSAGSMTDEKRRQKIQELKFKLHLELREYEDKKLEIEEFLIKLDNLDAKLLFSYVFIDGLSQEEAGELMGMEQSGISKKLSRYIKLYIPKEVIKQ